ncbi:MAG TPA: cupredoxin domain-containing protein, partial [Pricia sp.]|nr:cupredoxin domain-containing protein [Pricia sp.]
MKYRLTTILFSSIFLVFLSIGCRTDKKKESAENLKRDSTIIDREYRLEAIMLGYFAPDGTRNPTLKANKGDRVRITITNGETMTHDIAMEKLGIKSNTLLEEGSTTSISFWAEGDDTYYCTVPGHRAAGMVGKFQIVEGDISAPVIAGIVPMENGKPLNVGFERGNLSDWKTTGEAFKKPLFTRLAEAFKEDDQIGFDGDFFLSSGGTKNYKLKGTLTSVPFKVEYPFASFRVSGGALADTRVEIVLAESDEVIF